ncbi:MAG: hypothetical protein L6Q84_34925 [Polyangiaceae bacterium]|nr:hypothetical protein [Polyangiaceae bacterium]
MELERPTIAETPAAGAKGVSLVEEMSSSSAGTREHSTTQLPSPETVLLSADVEQTRRMAITGTLFNVVGGVCWPLIGGDPTAKTTPRSCWR